ncbi:MAG: hypothetical protein NTV52_03490, partial [Acidobacteria bacterium]|nr:hypothetical protein [Acidobacteriota bacterium]
AFERADWSRTTEHSAYFRCLNFFSLHHRATPSQVPSPLVPAYPGATLLRNRAQRTRFGLCASER